MKLNCFTKRNGVFFADGEIHECEIIEQIFTRVEDNAELTLRVKYAGGEIEIPADDFYKDAESYMKSERYIPTNENYVSNFDCYVIRDSQVERWNADEHWQTIRMHFDGYCSKFSCDQTPENSYSTLKEAEGWNTAVIEDENGEKRNVEGVLNLVKLNDEQKALVAEFETLCKKMSENGIKLFYDTEYNSMFALNSSNVKELNFSYCNEDEWEEIPNEGLHNFNVEFPASICYGDDVIVIKRKDE